MIRKIALIAASLVLVSTMASAQERPKSYDPSKGVPAAAQAPVAQTNAQAPAVRPADAKAQAGAAAANREAEIEKAKAAAIAKAEADAQAAYTAWKADKKRCLAEAGLNFERGDYIIDPARPLVIQVANYVWLQPTVYNIPKLRTCK